MSQSEQIRAAILAEVAQRPDTNPTRMIQQTFDISREAVRLHLRHLTEAGLLTAAGYGKARVYKSRLHPSQSQFLDRKLSTEFLRKSGEDEIYAQVIAPFIEDRTNQGLAAHHAEEGIFFSSRMSTRFSLTANGLTYIYKSKGDDWTVTPAKTSAGTEVEIFFDLADEGSPKEVFEKYTEDFTFSLKTPRLVAPYTIEMPKGDFPSRSEAKKILAGASEFKSIVVDFKQVDTIGQGFADEIFRVFHESHPHIEIKVIHANEFIQRMIAHVTRRV